MSVRCRYLPRGRNGNLINVIYLVAFVVLALAVARLTRLASKDDITAGMRLRIDGRFGENSFLSQLIWCPWCSGVWISAGASAAAVATAAVVASWAWWLAVVVWAFVTPAAAYAASWLINKEGD